MCIQILGALIAVAGTIISGVGQSKQLKAQEKAMRHNEEVAMLSAKDALERGDEAVRQHALEARRLLADQRMSMPGLDPASPLFSQIYDDTELFTMLDAEMILENSRREAWGHYTQAQGFDIQAEGMAGAQKWNTASTVIGSASAAAEGWYRFSRLEA